MRGSKRRGNNVDEGRDTKSNLQRDKSHHRVIGDHGWARDEGSQAVRVEMVTENGKKGGRGQHAVVKLNGCRVFKHVLPEQRPASRVGLGVVGIKELRCRRHNGLTHVRETVVDKTSVKTRNKAAGHGSKENKAKERSTELSKAGEGRVLEHGNFLKCRGRVLDPSGLSENVKTSEHHNSVKNKRSGKVSSESILRNTRVGARVLQELFIKTRLDHPPANSTLKTDQCGNKNNSSGNMRRCLASIDKVGSRQNDSQTNGAANKSMSPLHEKDELELR